MFVSAFAVFYPAAFATLARLRSRFHSKTADSKSTGRSYDRTLAYHVYHVNRSRWCKIVFSRPDRVHNALRFAVLCCKRLLFLFSFVFYGSSYIDYIYETRKPVVDTLFRVTGHVINFVLPRPRSPSFL